MGFLYTLLKYIYNYIHNNVQEALLVPEGPVISIRTAIESLLTHHMCWAMPLNISSHMIVTFRFSPVCFHVTCHSTTLSKLFYTLFTFVRFPTCVCSHVTCNDTIHLTTYMTFSLFPSVCFHVIFLSFTGSKKLPTNITFVRFLTCVCCHVPCHLTSRNELFSTHITFIRFLTCVCLHVVFQITTQTEMLSTHITFVGFSPVCIFMCVFILP